MYDTPKKLSWAKLRVGAVVTAGLAILFLAIVFAGSIRQLFLPQVRIFAEFSDVRGLRPGAPIWFAGVRVGSVKSIRFVEKEKLLATLDIDRSALTYLKKDSDAAIMTMGLLGDKYLELSMGSRTAAPLESGDTIRGSARYGIAESLQRIVEGVETSKGTLSRLLYDETLYRDLALSAKDIRAFAAELRSSRGTAGKLIRNPELYERFLRASKSLDDFSARLATSRGTVNRLVEDASLYEHMNSAAARLDAILERIEKGEGSVGTLIADRQVADELRSSLKEFNALVTDMREHPKKYFSFSIF